MKKISWGIVVLKYAYNMHSLNLKLSRGLLLGIRKQVVLPKTAMLALEKI